MYYFGHRGSPGVSRAGENTLQSFHAALQKGANALEFDVRRARDGVLVVIHDDSVNRTTNGKGRVAALTYAELRALDAGNGDHIPTLEEVLDSFAKRCLLNIELKEAGLGIEVARMVKEKSLEPHVIVSCFDADDSRGTTWWFELLEIGGLVSVAPIAKVKKIQSLGEEKYIAAALSMNAAALHIEKSAATQSLVSCAHEYGFLVHVWTVNSVQEMRVLYDLGVDGIMSDIPELFSIFKKED